MLAKVLTGVGVLLLATAVVLGMSAGAVSAAVTVAIALAGAVSAIIGIFKKST